jgi:hypothetical protein
MCQKLKKANQQLQRGYYTYFLLDTAQKLMEVGQELQSEYMSILLIRYALKVCGSRPGASKRI